MGFWEDDGKLIPKVFTMNLQLLVRTPGVDAKEKSLMEFFRKDGSFHKDDSVYWPFGAKLDKNTTLSTLSWTDYDGVDPYSVNNKATAQIGFACPRIKRRHAVFPAFIDTFSFNRAMSATPSTSKRFPLSHKTIINSLDKDSFKVELNIPSFSPIEALENHEKYQHLLRFGHVSTFGGNQRNTNSICSIYLANLIQYTNHPPAAGNHLDWGAIVTHGLRGTISNLSYTPDLELGFYKIGDQYFPKVFSLSIELDASTSEEGVDRGFVPFGAGGSHIPDPRVITSGTQTITGDHRRPFGVSEYTLDKILKQKK